MALTGLQIFKLLPNTNCKKCGCPTCLAFAMKLAAGKESLDKCPDASPEAYAYATEYVAADSLIPGRGYWIRNAGAGMVIQARCSRRRQRSTR